MDGGLTKIDILNPYLWASLAFPEQTKGITSTDRVLCLGVYGSPFYSNLLCFHCARFFVYGI